jgi:DNA-binding response OmpR family regulator
MKASVPAPRTGDAPHVLIVDDEPNMRMLLTDNLEFEGYRVTAVSSAEEALMLLPMTDCSLLILDVMLEGLSGFELCRKLRANGVTAPVIMLTARSEEADRIVGLELGADDYIAKPFSVPELLARIRSQLRRAAISNTPPRDEIPLGPEVIVSLRRRLVTRNGRRLKLSAREFELLSYMIAHQGEIVSREQLLRDVWGYHDETVTRTVDNYIAKLRSYLESRPRDPQLIVTVHGSGYQLLV